MRQIASTAVRAPSDPFATAGWLAHASEWLRFALRWGAHHTGLPAMLVAAIVLVASGHIVKRTLRFGIEVAVVLGLLFAATRFGWIQW